MKNEIVIVTTTFFPDPSVGSVRMVEFARYMLNKGWKVTVFCRFQGYEASNSGLKKEFDNDRIQVFYLDKPKNKSTTLKKDKLITKLKRSLSRIFRGLIVPDLSANIWISFIPTISNYLKRESINNLITSSPSHSVHLVGLHMKVKNQKLNWTADFRDPYLIDSRYKPKGLGRIFLTSHKTYYEKILLASNEVLFAIPVDFRWAKKNYSQFRDKFTLVLNGAPEFISTIKSSRSYSRGTRVASIGRIGEAYCRQLCRIISKSQKITGFDIVGFKPEGLDSSVEKSNKIAVHGQVPHKSAMNIMIDADILIAALDFERSQATLLSSKLFEYCYTDKPILVINPTVSDRWLLKDYEKKIILVNPTEKEVAESLDKLLSIRGCPLYNSNYLRGFQFDKIVTFN